MNFNTLNKWIPQQYKNYIYYFIALLLLTLFNAVFINFLEIMDYTPDLFIILVVWITLKEGRLTGLIAGFVIGLYIDFISMEVIGINAFTKTITAFVVSYFYKENAVKNITKGYKFILIVLLASFINNFAYFLLLIKTSQNAFILMYIKYCIATTIYTTFFACFILLFQISSHKIKLNS